MSDHRLVVDAQFMAHDQYLGGTIDAVPLFWMLLVAKPERYPAAVFALLVFEELEASVDCLGYSLVELEIGLFQVPEVLPGIQSPQGMGGDVGATPIKW